MATKKRKMPKSKFMMGELKGAKMPKSKYGNRRTRDIQRQMGSAASGIKTDVEKRKRKPLRQIGKRRKISGAMKKSYKRYRRTIGKKSQALTKAEYHFDVPRYSK